MFRFGLALHIVASLKSLALSSLDSSSIKLCYYYCMIRFVQQISSVDFQKEELDHACWESPRIRVAGVVLEKRG